MFLFGHSHLCCKISAMDSLQDTEAQGRTWMHVSLAALCPVRKPSSLGLIVGNRTQVLFVFTSQFGALSSVALTRAPKHILPLRLTGILSSSNCVRGGESDLGRTPNLECSLQFNPAPSCTGWCDLGMPLGCFF